MLACLLLLGIFCAAGVAQHTLCDSVGSCSVNTMPQLVAGLMIKNEEATIGVTLASIAAQNVRHVYLYDTGSTDRTRKVAQQFNQT